MRLGYLVETKLGPDCGGSGAEDMAVKALDGERTGRVLFEYLGGFAKRTQGRKSRG
jgi:hypothetical protein